MIEVAFRRGETVPHYIEEMYDGGLDRWILTLARPATDADKPRGPSDHYTVEEVYGEPEFPGDPPVVWQLFTKIERRRARIVSGAGIIDAYIGAHELP